MRTDRQADIHDEANSRFSQFCQLPKRAVRNCSRQDIVVCFTQLRTGVVGEFCIVARSAC